MLSNSLIHCVASGNAIFLPIFNLLRRWAPDGDRVACSAVFTRCLDSPRLSFGWRRVGVGRLLLPVSCGLTRVPGEAGGRAARSGLRSHLSTAGPITPKLACNWCRLHSPPTKQLSRLTYASFCYVLVLHMGWQVQHLVLSWLKGICMKRCVVLTNRACVQCA